MTKPSKYFPSQISDDHFVEIVETATGKVEKRMGPMSESKADKVEMGVLHRIDLDRFFVRTGTDAALKKEAAHDEPPVEALQRAGIVSSDPNAKRTKPAGSSPTLRIACPVCGAAGRLLLCEDGWASTRGSCAAGHRPQTPTRGRGANTMTTEQQPRVRTDVDARKVDGTVTSTQLSSTKLMKIKLDDGPTIVRHADRVEALNEAATRFWDDEPLHQTQDPLP